MRTTIDGWVRQIEAHNKERQWARIENRDKISIYSAGWGRSYAIHLRLKGEFVETGKTHLIRPGWNSAPVRIRSKRFAADPSVFEVRLYGTVIWRVNAKDRLLRADNCDWAFNRAALQGWPYRMLLPHPIHAHYHYAGRHDDGYTYLTGFKGDVETVVNDKLVLREDDDGITLVEGHQPLPKEAKVTLEGTRMVRHVMRRIRQDLLPYDQMREGQEYPDDHIFGHNTLNGYIKNRDGEIACLIQWLLQGSGYDCNMHARLLALTHASWRVQQGYAIDFDSYAGYRFRKQVRAYVYCK